MRRWLGIVAATVSALLLIGAASAQQVVTVKMNPMNGSGIHGTATLTPQGNDTKVVLTLTGEPVTASMPAHIHAGQCGHTLNIRPLYPLHSVENGTSTTVVNAPLRLLTTGHFAINVHESEANLQQYVACGNIPKTTWR
jgi:hypothetical protein